MISFFKKIFKSEKLLVRFLFGVSMAFYFIFGFYHLADFISADEHFWLPNSGSERIADYWRAVGKKDWKDTRINDKPGITLAYTSGIAMLLVNDPKSQIIEGNGTYKQFNPEKTKEINFLYRLPILLLSGFSSLFFFWIIKKITNNSWIALFSASGILLSPVLLGISQIVNPDSLFWIFASASIFSFFAFLQKGERKLAVFSSIFLGLGLASKYVTVILFPFFLIMMLVYYFFEYEKIKEEKINFAKTIIKNGLCYVAILLGGMVIFAVLMPASFVEPKVFYEGTIGFPGMQSIFWAAMAINLVIILDALIFKSKGFEWLLQKLRPLENILPKIVYAILFGTVFFVILNWLSRNSLIDLSEIPFNLKRSDLFSELPYYKRFIMEFVPLTFALTPIALLLLMFAWFRGMLNQIKNKTFAFVLAIFFLIFIAAIIEQGLLVTVRYSIILFPLSMVFGSIALVEFFSDLQKKQLDKRGLKFFTFAFSTVVVLFASMLVQQRFFDGIYKNAFVDRLYRDWLGIIFIFIVTAVATFILYKIITWKKFKNISLTWIFSLVIFCNIVSILLITPFYFSYTNNLLPKSYIINGAWGYGGYEAAQYLNNQPNAKNLILWADVYGVCEFFVGKCIHKAKVDVQKYPIDYYFQSLQSTISINFPHAMEKNSVWRMEIDKREKSFLKIRKAKTNTSGQVVQDDSSSDEE
jgi:hypothetical protein